jgi:hypothetical protein
MNAPAKRFSLQRLLTTTPAPAPASIPPGTGAPAPVKPPEPILVAPPPLAAAVVAFPEDVALPPPADAPRPLAVPTRLVKTEESHPKKKRSYSVDMKICEDLEILAWYQSRSSSSVVEELIRKHLQHQKSLLLKAREVRSSR